LTDRAGGLFLVLEGIDGAGKSEQARALAEWLRARGEEVVLTREPTGGEWGLRYRRFARGELELSPDEVLRCFVLDRREHVAKLVRPALARGAVVVCDRYVASTLAYQAAQGIDRGVLRARLDAEDFPSPDATLWLRLPVSVALARLGQSANERFERTDFLARVDAEYARLGLIEIDASGTREAVQAAIRRELAPILGNRGQR
jgi:dTMP kinase